MSVAVSEAPQVEELRTLQANVRVRIGLCRRRIGQLVDLVVFQLLAFLVIPPRVAAYDRALVSGVLDFLESQR